MLNGPRQTYMHWFVLVGGNPSCSLEGLTLCLKHHSITSSIARMPPNIILDLKSS